MTVTQFKYVLEIVKTGSINKAAKNLFVSQSVLSSSIKNLEREFGRQIFFRSNKGIELTAFGHDFVAHIKPITIQIDQLTNMMASSSIDFPISVSITSSGFYLMSNVISALYKKYQNTGIRVDSYEGSIDDITSMVYHQVAEVGIMRRWSCYRASIDKQLKSLNLRFHPIASLDIGITIGQKSPLFHSASDYVSREELRPFPAVMYSYMDSGPYSDIYDRLGLPNPPSKMVTLSRAMVYEMLGYTDAYYLNSLYTCDRSEFITKGIPYQQRTLQLKDCDIKSEIGWIKLEQHTLSPIASEIINMVSDHINGNIYS